MKIELPEGYELPADVKDGGTFEELTTYRVEGEYLVPTMIAGVEIASEDDSEKAPSENATPEEEMAAAEMEKSPMRGMGRRVMGMA
jgi:hypothetical protein